MDANNFVTKVGVFKPFVGKIGSDSERDNLYTCRVVTINSSDGNVTAESIDCIFTEKELNRATVRYYNDADLLYSPKEKVVESALGFISPTTYNNREGILTTRFIVRFDGTNVAGLNSNSCIGLFTSREFKRSIDRMKWHVENSTSLLSRLRRWLHV